MGLSSLDVILSAIFRYGCIWGRVSGSSEAFYGFLWWEGWVEELKFREVGEWTDGSRIGGRAAGAEREVYTVEWMHKPDIVTPAGIRQAHPLHPRAPAHLEYLVQKSDTGPAIQYLAPYSVSVLVVNNLYHVRGFSVSQIDSLARALIGQTQFVYTVSTVGATARKPPCRAIYRKNTVAPTDTEC